MNSFFQYCNHCNNLSLNCGVLKEEIAMVTKKATFEKGDIIVKKGGICHQLFYIEEGLIKVVFHKEKNEFILCFCHENETFTILESFQHQTPSDFTIIALETTTVSYIEYNDMERLCKNHHCIETYFLKLISHISLQFIKRTCELLQDNSIQRYNYFINKDNDLFNRISLGDLSHYLGVNQVTLSKIRRKR